MMKIKWLLPLLGIGIVSLLFTFAPTEKVAGIPPIMSYDGKSVTLGYTDENTGEDLIIYSDSASYLGLRHAPVKFSIENTSGKDQNVKIAFSINGKVEYIKRLVDTTTTIRPVLVATSSDPVPSTLADRDGWVEEKLDTFSSTNAKRKDVKGIPTEKESGSYFIKSGDTAFFEAVISYEQEGEFIIEAFGDQGGYGSLDPIVSFVSAGAIVSDTTGGCSITPTPPTHQINDVIVVSAWNTGGDALSTATAGWSEITEIDGTGNAAWYWKLAPGAGTAGPTITAAGTDCFAVAYIIRGADFTQTPPFEDATASGDGTTADGTPDSAAITSTGVNRMAAVFLAHDDNTLWTPDPHSPPAGWTSSSDLVSGDGTDVGFTVITKQVNAEEVASVAVGTFTGGATELYGALTLAFLPDPWVAEDDFEDYTSNIQTEYGGSGWAGSSGWEIGRTFSFARNTSSPIAGTIDAKASADDTGNQRTLTTALDTGMVQFKMKRSDKTTGVLDFKVQITGTDKCKVQMGTSDLVVRSAGGSQTLVSGYSTGVTYHIHLQFDDTAGTCKARLDADAAWSGTVPEQTDGDVDIVALDFIGGASGTGQIDSIAPGSEPAAADTGGQNQRRRMIMIQ